MTLRWTNPGGGARVSRGQSLVELAITLPIMITLLMGVIDVGFTMYGSLQVAAASYEGARQGAVFPGDLGKTDAQNQSDRTTVVQNAIYNSGTGTGAMGLLSTSSPNFNVGTDVLVSFPGTPTDPLNTTRRGMEMVVQVTYHQPVFFKLLPGTSSGLINVSTTTKVRIQ